MRDDPVLILGTGNRCGSTLVQRLVSSAPGTLVWGEHGGGIRGLLEGLDGMEYWAENVAPRARSEFAAGGYQSFMANLMPDNGAVLAATRAFIERLYAVPAEELGFERWGFKEIRLGLKEAETLHRLFPKLVAVHVTRDPRDMLRSLDRWEREGYWDRAHSRKAIDTWATVNESMLGPDPLPDWIRSWRYEDLLADRAAFIADVADLLGVAPGDLDAGVFDKRIGDYKTPTAPTRPWSDLPREVRRLVRQDRVRRVAAALRYDL